jgi:hypothetical protein
MSIFPHENSILLTSARRQKRQYMPGAKMSEILTGKCKLRHTGLAHLHGFGERRCSVFPNGEAAGGLYGAVTAVFERKLSAAE